MTENKRFKSWGKRIKDRDSWLNINFETKRDAVLCCKLLNRMENDNQDYIDKLEDIFKWHKEHYGKSILDEKLEFKSDCEKENEQLKKENMELKMIIKQVDELEGIITHVLKLIDKKIEEADYYRKPIHKIQYGDDLGYWNGVYQQMRKLKQEILE